MLKLKHTPLAGTPLKAMFAELLSVQLKMMEEQPGEQQRPPPANCCTFKRFFFFSFKVNVHV